MGNGFCDRLTRLRAHRSVSTGELSAVTGLPQAELVALESGRRRTLAPEALRRLAEYFLTTPEYLLDGAEPSPEAIRAGFLRYYDGLRPGERQALKFAPIQERIAAVLHYLEAAYPTLFRRPQVAARLGYTLAALDDVLRGAAPLETLLLDQLAALSGLPRDFLVRGDFFGGAAPEQNALSPERLSQYYAVVLEAAAAGISPAALRKAVQILSIRDQEE